MVSLLHAKIRLSPSHCKKRLEQSWLGDYRRPLSYLVWHSQSVCVYRTYLHEVEPARILYLAVDSEAYAEVFYDISGRILLDVNHIKLIVVDADLEEITEWIS